MTDLPPDDRPTHSRPRADPVGWYIATLHGQLGHDATAAWLGVEQGDKSECLLCIYEREPTAVNEIIVEMALAPQPEPDTTTEGGQLLMASATANQRSAKKPKHTQLITGKRVHLRRTQMGYWSAVAGLLGAGFIAGLYFLVLQMHWHLDIGPVRWAGFSLKNWWDNLNPFGISNAEWAVYRHAAFRDIAEPSFAVMGVRTLLARPKYWNNEVGTLRLVTAPFILIAMTISLGLGGTWLVNYGLPEPVRHLLAHGQVGNLLLGVIIGTVLHRFWEPVGATYQGRLLKNAAARAKNAQRVPRWVRRPLAPPVVRERFSGIHRSLTPADMARIERVRGVNRWSLTVMTTGFTVVTAVGLIAHYWIGKGHTFPYLSS